MKWWNVVVQLKHRGRQPHWGYGVGVLALFAGLLASCLVVESGATTGTIDGSPATTLRPLTQFHARSGVAAIVDLPSELSVTAIPAGPQRIGSSVEGLPIESYTYGTGPMRVAFVGGIHGGTEWNTVLLAYAAIDYFDRHPDAVPPGITLQIVSAANPDGLHLVTATQGRFLPEAVGTVVAEARFNRNGVDLNRNWDCDWAETAWWGTTETSGGSAPFSEPETRTLRDFFLGDGDPVQAVVFWHSAVPGVFAGGCSGIYPAAERLATIYAQAAGYPHGDSFSYYPITGDATNWLSTQNIPAIIVELRTRDDPEWSQNLAGMLAVLDDIAGGEQIVTVENMDVAIEPQLAR